MKGWLLDTNVISELRRSNCDARVKAWSESLSQDELYLSSITVAEIRYGIELLADTAFRAELATWLEQVLRPWFGERILPVDEDVILEWRRLVETGRAQGIVFSQPDLFIAASARRHDLGVATRNLADFRLTGVPLVDPWSGEGH